MRRLPVVSGIFIAGALAVAACGSTPGASTGPTRPAVVVPSIAIPSFAIPSFAIPSFAIPSFPAIGSFALPSFAFPSFSTNADPDLAAKFPQTIDGQPVTEVQTVNFVEFEQAFGGLGGTDATAKLQALLTLLANNGINPSTLSFGSGQASVNGNDVQIQAFRTPGSSAATFVSLWPQLAAIDQTDEQLPTAGSVSLGGKTITTFTDSDGNVTYVYPSGDTVWSLDNSDPTEAAAVFSAIQ